MAKMTMIWTFFLNLLHFQMYVLSQNSEDGVNTNTCTEIFINRDISLGFTLDTRQYGEQVYHYVCSVNEDSIASEIGIEKNWELLLVNKTAIINKNMGTIQEVFSDIEVYKSFHLIFRYRVRTKLGTSSISNRRPWSPGFWNFISLEAVVQRMPGKYPVYPIWPIEGPGRPSGPYNPHRPAGHGSPGPVELLGPIGQQRGPGTPYQPGPQIEAGIPSQDGPPRGAGVPSQNGPSRGAGVPSQNGPSRGPERFSPAGPGGFEDNIPGRPGGRPPVGPPGIDAPGLENRIEYRGRITSKEARTVYDNPKTPSCRLCAPGQHVPVASIFNVLPYSKRCIRMFPRTMPSTCVSRSDNETDTLTQLQSPCLYSNNSHFEEFVYIDLGQLLSGKSHFYDAVSFVSSALCGVPCQTEFFCTMPSGHIEYKKVSVDTHGFVLGSTIAKDIIFVPHYVGSSHQEALLSSQNNKFICPFGLTVHSVQPLSTCLPVIGPPVTEQDDLLLDTFECI